MEAAVAPAALEQLACIAVKRFGLELWSAVPLGRCQGCRQHTLLNSTPLGFVTEPLTQQSAERQVHRLHTANAQTLGRATLTQSG